MICLDNKSNIIGFFEVARGTVNEVWVSFREIFKRVFVSNAPMFILAHNHLSGDATPSTADIEFTKNLLDVSVLLGLVFIDDLIISGDNYYSVGESEITRL